MIAAKKLLRRCGWALFIAAAVIATAFIGIVLYGRASLPTLEGRLPVEKTRLAQQVDIVRDAHGIPHLLGKTDGDVYFALGFVHAQDRLWQLDIDRRIASGTLAAVMGAGALPIDKFMRTLGVNRNAERIYKNLDPVSRSALEHYADGINYFLHSRSGPLPIEYALTRAPPPADWQPRDSLAWLTVLAWDLSGNMAMQIERMRLAQYLPLERIHQFITTAPEDLSRLPVRDYVHLYRSLPQLAQLEQAGSNLLAAAPSQHLDAVGSNNWVVDGNHSDSGKPLLANDPHLALSEPGLFYLAHLQSDRLQLVGGTVPGLPIVLIGHNDRIAWGLTNTGTNIQDLFLETVNPRNPAQYRTPDGWAPFQVRDEIIEIKGEPSLSWAVRETRHGPVISDVSTNAAAAVGKSAGKPDRQVLALQWVALMPDDRTFKAALGFNHAENWAGFMDAARDFGAPQQNIVYADTSGNIGFIAPGRVPLRKTENDLRAEAPAPGWDARYDWTGFVPFEGLPQAYNPPQGTIVTANNRIVPDAYPYFLTGEWVLPYRAKRIAARLAAYPRHNLNTFAAIQSDIRSTAMQELLPLLLTTSDSGSGGDSAAGADNTRRAIGLLKAWDGEARRDRPEALLAAAWERELTRTIFQPHVGAQLFKEYWGQRNLHQALLNVLRSDALGAYWCNPPGSDAAAPCSALLRPALARALQDLRLRYGDNTDAWRWGQAHAGVATHRPFHKVGWLARWFDVSVPLGGDMLTVNVSGNDFSDADAPYATRMAAALRMLVDMKQPDQARFILPTGQSGNRFSQWHTDLLPLWAGGAYVAIPTDREKIDRCDCKRLALVPVRG